MALIPIVGLGAPSQNTSLLGGVTKNPYIPKIIPMLADVGLFVRPKSQQNSPRNDNVNLLYGITKEALCLTVT